MTAAMSKKELVMRAVASLECDRLPVIPNTRMFSPQYAGIKYGECVTDPDKNMKAELKAFQDFDYDAVWGSLSYGVLEGALGCQVTLLEDDAPAIGGSVLRENADLGLLDIPEDITALPQVERICRGNERLRSEIGRDVMIIGSGPGALFRTAAFLRGIDNLYMDLVENQDFVVELQERIFKPSLDFAVALFQSGVDIIFIGNAVASGSCISRDHYQECVHPINKRFFAALHAKCPGSYVMYHTCGKWNDRFDLVMEEQPDIIHVGVEADLAELATKWGQEACFMGNISSVATMLKGTPEDVDRETTACIEKAWGKGGFILSNDCVLPRSTPPANLAKMMEAGRRYQNKNLLREE